MSIVQRSANKKFLLSRKVIGIYPIIQFFIEKLNIHQIINSYFPQDQRMTLSFENAICVLVHNILGASSPMYEISDWCKRLDEGCIGLDDGEAQHICDDRIGRSLEKFYNGRHKDFFFQLALRSIKIFKLNVSSVHQDTTTITLSGKYESWSAMERATFGHNKDHRPDLKQLVLGLTVTHDGAVPLLHKVYSGNQSDDTLHIQNFQKIRTLLQSSDFIYVADSKLATFSNLLNIHSFGGRFISIMPRTWAENNEFRDKLRGGKILWSTLWKKNDGDEEDAYSLAKGKYQAKQFRLLWIRSFSKKAIDAEVRTDRLRRANDDLNAFSIKLNKRSLKDEARIVTKIEEILKTHQCKGLIDYSLTSEREYQREYKRAGRPGPGIKAKVSWKNIYSLNFVINEEKVISESLCDGIFPLITNVGDKDPKEILELYKYQPFLEKRHSQLKTWQKITPVLLKKDVRVIAYIHMHVLALTISTLIERTIRQSMKKEGIKSLPIYPEGHPCFCPTFYDLERLFRDVEKYDVQKGDNVIYFPAELKPLHKQVLSLLSMPQSAYH